MGNTQKLILISGKRKCGKDFVSELLLKRLGTDAEIIRISEPIKSHWAKEKGLSLDGLLGDGPYKEKYRKEMIIWSDEVRAKDAGYFCRAAIARSTKPIVIISDIRRITDINFFKENLFCFKTVRIDATEEVRKSRGWKFKDNVDNVQSECGLDDYNKWDLYIENNSDIEPESLVKQILEIIK